MRAVLLATLALICLLGSPLRLPAQDAVAGAYRQGFWIGFGLGAGQAQVDCSRCGWGRPDPDPWDGGTGLAVYLAMGGTPRPNLLVGGELNAYGKQSITGTREASLGGGGVVLQYYPATDARFYVKGGAGFGGVTLRSSSTYIESQGFSLQAGAGYDFLLTRRFALVPYITLVQVIAESAESRDSGEVVFGPSNPRYTQFGLGFHWY